MRGTTRDPRCCPAIQAAGAEAYVGDPDRVATLTPALEHVTVCCLLLGSARGAPSAVADLHGTRLEMLLGRMLDSTVHGIVYEAAGDVDRDVLAGGTELVRASCQRSRIPFALLTVRRGEARWLEHAVAAVERALVPTGAKLENH